MTRNRAFKLTKNFFIWIAVKQLKTIKIFENNFVL